MCFLVVELFYLSKIEDLVSVNAVFVDIAWNFEQNKNNKNVDLNPEPLFHALLTFY